MVSLSVPLLTRIKHMEMGWTERMEGGKGKSFLHGESCSPLWFTTYPWLERGGKGS